MVGTVEFSASSQVHNHHDTEHFDIKLNHPVASGGSPPPPPTDPPHKMWE